MACGKFENKLQFLCFHLKRIEHFLLFSKDNLPQPWCEQGKPIPLLGAKGNVKKKWVSLILKELIKTFPTRQKLLFFSLSCYKNRLIAENLIDIYMWKSSRDFYSVI